MVTGYNQSVRKARQREVVESFSYMALEGRVDLREPVLELWCFEECAPLNSHRYVDLKVINMLDGPKDKPSLRPNYDGDGVFICVWFGRLVCSYVI